MSAINRFLLKFLILAAMLLGLPLLGVFAAGYPIARYLEFPPQTRYVTHAPFSTVLPAVLSTRQWFLSHSWIRQAYGSFKPLKLPRPDQVAVIVLALSAAGLTGIGVWPNYFFPLLWISPLLIIICLQTLMKEPHILSQMAKGDWSGAISAALAATVCGVFWEMWNYFSLAKWEYGIPLVHRFPIFEMPLLGYAGYLPFGLQCAVIGSMVSKLLGRDSG